MACDSSITRPIDSFIKYFYDIKPYHTKILEIIEQYVFKEEIHVEMLETTNIEVTIENDPLCKGVGFGLDFDDECGFDALECCDLFECVGGFGLIFDNSDKLVELPIANIDSDQGTITLSGYHAYDTYFNVKSIPDVNTIILDGDRSSYFNNHKMFWVVRRNVYDIVSYGSNTITVEGNVADQMQRKVNIEIQLTGINDGHYGVLNAVYSGGNTTITVNRDLNPSASLGRILVSASNKNNGIYQIAGYTVQGDETHLELAPNTPARLTDAEVNGIHGAVRLRTGLIPMRRIWVADSSVNEESEWKITHVRLDSTTSTTVITVDGMLADDYVSPVLKIYGYESGAGFDGFNECSTPQPFNIHTYFSEYLSIEEYDMIGVTPTSTPTPTVTPTPSPIPIDIIEDTSEWRYLQVPLSDTEDYSGVSVDTSTWNTGASPFANTVPHPYVEDVGWPNIRNTNWSLNTKLWLRIDFDVATPSDLLFHVFVDNYCTVWVNGVEVLPRSGSSTTPSGPIFDHHVTIPANVLVPGNNVIAVLGEDYGSYSYMTCRLVRDV